MSKASATLHHTLQRLAAGQRLQVLPTMVGGSGVLCTPAAGPSMLLAAHRAFRVATGAVRGTLLPSLRCSAGACLWRWQRPGLCKPPCPNTPARRLPMENGLANGGAAAKRRRRRGQSSLGARAGGGAVVAAPPQLEALPAPAGPRRGLAPVAGRFMSSTTAEHLTSTRFADLEGIAPLTKRCGARCPASQDAPQQADVAADTAAVRGLWLYETELETTPCRLPLSVFLWLLQRMQRRLKKLQALQAWRTRRTLSRARVRAGRWRR